MKRSFTLLFLLFSLQAFAQWQPVQWPGIDTSIVRLWQITCLRQINGKHFACAANGLFRSEDDGVHWTKIDGFPPQFRPMQLTESDEGLFLTGLPAPGYPNIGYVNKDKQGYLWQPSVPLPFFASEGASFVQIGNVYFAIGFAGGINLLERSANGGQNWTPLQASTGTDPIARFTWHHDTIYINFLQDRHIYRSVDFGESFALFSAGPVRGFQVTDGLCVGQLLTDGPALTDTMLISTDQGQNWFKRQAAFLPDNETCFLFKYPDAEPPGGSGRTGADIRRSISFAATPGGKRLRCRVLPAFGGRSVAVDACA